MDKLPNDKLPNDKLPNDKLPNDKLPNDKLPNDKLPNDKLPNDKLQEYRIILTGDELTVLGDEPYCTVYKDGTVFVLGRLLERYKYYSHFHEAYSLYNNIFVFENKPDRTKMTSSEEGWHNHRIFFAQPSTEKKRMSFFQRVAFLKPSSNII